MSSSQELYVSALDAIAELRRTGSDLEPMLDYWAAILRAQQEVESSFHPDMGSLDAEQCSRRAAEERPALEPEEIDLDGELFDDLFNRLSGISAEHAVGKDVAATEWPSAPSGDVEWHEKVVRGLLEKREALDELVDGAGVTREVFAFLAGQALTPFLEAYAERARELIDDAKWLREVCPVCGGAPLMAKLEGEAGKRTLQCHLCRTEWTYPRVGCPFCGTKNQEKLRFFYDEKDELHRVDVCDECKRYIKTVDVRKAAKPVVLLVDNLVTIHLDIVAQREGFRGAAP